MKRYTKRTIDRRMINEAARHHDFHTVKSLGQNFIIDEGVIEAIAEGAAIGQSDLVIEIGPGMGVLTAAAAARAGRIVAVEIDQRLLPILEQTLAGFDNVRVVCQDILKTDLKSMIREEQAADPSLAGVKIIGNLPYYITTPIIMKLLTEELPLESITIMMQREVAERIRSGAGSRTYGVLSLSVQYYCEVESVVRVPKEAFRPRPKVDSEVLRLRLRREKPVQVRDEATFFGCIRAGFRARRKTLANCLTGFCGASKEEASAIMISVGIDPGRRAETLDMEEFARLADAFEKRK